ncbi:MAG: efflux RND transporter periplasmic adaptor subunit [Xanthomonadales bacterium]|nr:efflux RND transporter periplasmic adaptor subunit [Xanthomonadales bacterium]
MRLTFFAPLLLAGVLAACSRAPQPAEPAPPGRYIHAGGIVEPAGEERLLIPQLTGRVERVLVEEGDAVTAGQLLAELDNAEQRAALAAAEAQVAQSRATLAELRNGPRAEDIAAARAAESEAAALERQAMSELRRREGMAARKLISEEALETARTQAATAVAARKRARAQLDLLLAGTRPEAIDAAAAVLAAAGAERDRAAALLEKTRVRSPIDGVVLQSGLKSGETVTALSPEPVASVGDVQRLMVRADIDELDIGRVQVGAAATVSADAFPGRSFAGQVSEVGRRMGARRAISDDPTQRRDSKTLEAHIALGEGAELPIGLRVDVRIEAVGD